MTAASVGSKQLVLQLLESSSLAAVHIELKLAAHLTKNQTCVADLSHITASRGCPT